VMHLLPACSAGVSDLTPSWLRGSAAVVGRSFVRGPLADSTSPPHPPTPPTPPPISCSCVCYSCAPFLFHFSLSFFLSTLSLLPPCLCGPPNPRRRGEKTAEPTAEKRQKDSQRNRGKPRRPQATRNGAVSSGNVSYNLCSSHRVPPTVC
jgi:hypothetical protein